MVKKMEYNNGSRKWDDEIIVTSDGKKWIYDDRHGWINVTPSKKMLRLLKEEGKLQYLK